MIKGLKKYRGFVLNAIKEQYAYKFKAFIWTFYDLILLFVQFFLWKAIFKANNDIIYDVPLNQYINYIVVGMVSSRFLICFLDEIIASQVKNGNIAINFVKPYSYIIMNFARQIGYFIGGFITIIPLLTVCFLITGFIKVSIVTLLSYILSMIFSFFIVTFFNIILGICAFWITNYWGLKLLKWHFFIIFSGELMAITMFFKIAENGIKNFPLPLSEQFIQGLFKFLGIASYCLPFQAMGYTPTAIYTGLISGGGTILFHLGLQIFWIIIMILLLNIVWNIGKRHVTVLGG